MEIANLVYFKLSLSRFGVQQRRGEGRAAPIFKRTYAPAAMWRKA